MEKGINHPLVSIIMPVYNGERYLREAIDSIIGQTYTDWELILVNDCSTDTTLAIMNTYKSQDMRVRVINNEVNQKLPRSLNIGFTQAVGTYFTWTSDDNRYKPEALKQMLQYLEENRTAGMVYADMDYINEKGEKIGCVSMEVKEIYGHNCVGACFLYRREVARAIGEYDADLFLVEDYDYWLRIAKQFPIVHLPLYLYEYRIHGESLTQTKIEKIGQQLYRLRCRELDFLLSRVEEQEREELFIDMWKMEEGRGNELRKKFFEKQGFPRGLKWIERNKRMDENKKIILFGAGTFGKKALDYFGNDQVSCFVDNNPTLIGTWVNGKEVISFDCLKEIWRDYQTVISVDARKIPILAAQLEENGIVEYTAYLDMVNHLKMPSGRETIAWLEVCQKARKWIENHTISGGGIAHSSSLMKSYPEVTGYYIPTLMRWGFLDLAVSYGEWLCSIQHSNGAWYDVEGNTPYVFDSAQILKGLLAVRDKISGADEAVRRGCNWILSNIDENGRLTTPSIDAWGENGVCSELIHLYCLSPLFEAAEIFGEERYRKSAEKAVDYYVSNFRKEICDFSFLSHFYAYVMEALCDIGQEKLAKEAMKKIEVLMDEKGYVPAYRDVNWVCSTGMFQLAVVWFKLGDLEHGNRALTYAARLQNKSGGWYGSYPMVDAPKAVDRAEFPDYMAGNEISWAVKYFLDAVYFKNKLEFERQSSDFHGAIGEDDGRYQVILNEIRNQKAMRILDVGCGKGRYLKNLVKAVPAAEYRGVDISVRVMQSIKPPIKTQEGILTQIPYRDETFDLVYAAEALEHSIFPDNAVREMLRVTAPGGEVIIIDKNKELLGLLEIDEWEQWFEDQMFELIAEKENCILRTVTNVSYEDGMADGLFRAWILKKQ